MSGIFEKLWERYRKNTVGVTRDKLNTLHDDDLGKILLAYEFYLSGVSSLKLQGASGHSAGCSEE